MNLPLNVDLKDKVAVVTGAGGVLCSMFAKALAKTGAKVALLDRNVEAANMYAKEIVDTLKEQGFRVVLDDRDEKLGYKMREAQIKKYPYNLILGQKEVDSNTVSYRLHGNEETITIEKGEFIEKLKNEIETKGIVK